MNIIGKYYTDDFRERICSRITEWLVEFYPSWNDQQIITKLQQFRSVGGAGVKDLTSFQTFLDDVREWLKFIHTHILKGTQEVLWQELEKDLDLTNEHTKKSMMNIISWVEGLKIVIDDPVQIVFEAICFSR